MIASTTMTTPRRTPTTDMQVTSIRLEPELKEKLRELAGNIGYQTLIREILWEYVEQRSQQTQQPLTPSDIRVTVVATARQSEYCAITGRPIPLQQPMLLGLTTAGNLVPLCPDSLT